MRYGKHLSTEAVNRKYAHCMKEIYDITKNGGFIRAYDIAKKHNVTSGLMASLTRLKIVDKVKLDERGINYIWKVAEPNIALANTVRNDINAHTNHKKQKDSPAPQWPFLEQFKNRESEESFNKRKEICKPFADKVLVDLREMIKKEELKELLKELLTEIKEDSKKPKKRLKFRNPFYWVEK